MSATMTSAEQIAPNDPAADKTFSEKELDKQAGTLAETRQRLEDLREEKAQLDDRIAQAVTGESEEDVEDLRERRQEVHELISDFSAAVPLLERRIRARRMRRLRDLAEERLQTVKKQIGGLAGEAPRRMERLDELLEEVRDALEFLGTAKHKRRHLRQEARILAGAFGLELPEFKELDVDRSEARDAVKGVVDAVSWPRGVPNGERAVLRNLEHYGVDSPALDLLDRLEELQEGGEGEAG